MADEIITTPSTETTSYEVSETEKRIKQLSEKVRLTAEERDEKDSLLQQQSAKIAEVERERDFFASFSDVVASNPAAKEHKDEILAKVRSGYTTEDATFAVLGKAGKLPSQIPLPPDSPAGGSADTAPSSGGAKEVRDMTQAEKLSALRALEQSGDLFR
jgi:hypothetical protein